MNPYIISKEILDSIRECILSIFWPKKDVIDFFKSCGCSSNILNLVYNKKDELSRKAIIDFIIENLCNNTHNGIIPLRSIIHELEGWSSFNNIHFAAGGSLDIQKAKDAIRHLKELQEAKGLQISAAIKKRQELENEAQKIIRRDNLKRKYHLLYKCMDEDGIEISSQRRGYLLEEFLMELAIYEGLTIAEHYKLSIPGEQIDGVLKHDGHYYIIEAKWQEKLIASNALYQFANKVNGKMDGRGIFISINGFSYTSVEALTRGKPINCILIDGDDLALIVGGQYTFPEVLDQKIKAAQMMGNIYVNVYDLKNKCLAA
ncbi:restriction endonuclease [uncultured Pontibacter sp.]|uniref:restriction endonuclease n=1 Tax=uncultured Pontibacter sp. TaxID=453356 RepID=UPI002637D5FB|nr:restriction endonuclease [uncultured Pontibacter sp.]